MSVGDVVRPKDGGIAMTVERVQGDKVVCVWFERREFKRREFDAAQLMRDGAS